MLTKDHAALPKGYALAAKDCAMSLKDHAMSPKDCAMAAIDCSMSPKDHAKSCIIGKRMCDIAENHTTLLKIEQRPQLWLDLR